MAGERDDTSKIILQISIRTLINIILVFILVEGFVWCYQFSYRVFADIPYIPGSQNEVTITIEQGENARQIANAMEQNGLVEDDRLFLARIYLGKYTHKILAGSYTLSPGMTTDAICKKICGIQNEESS